MKKLLLSLILSLSISTSFALIDITQPGFCDRFEVKVECASTTVNKMDIRITAPGMTYTIAGIVYTGDQIIPAITPLFYFSDPNFPTFIIYDISGIGTIFVDDVLPLSCPGGGGPCGIVCADSGPAVSRSFSPGVPPVISGSTASLCENATRTFTGSPSGGTWSVVSGGGTVNASTGVYTPANITSDVTVTLKYTVSCVSTNVSFLVNSLEQVGFLFPGSICENQTNTLVPIASNAIFSVISGGGFFTGNVYTPNNISVAVQPIVINHGQPLGSACVLNSTSGFDVYGIAENTTTTAAICEGSTKNLTAAPSGGTWSIVSGGGTISGNTYTSPLVSSNTNVIIRYTYDNPSSSVPVACDITTSDVSFTVTDNLASANNTTSTAAICEGGTKALSATPAGGSWSVVTGGGSISGTTYTTSTVSSNTTITVRYTVPASGGCPASTSDISFTVNDNLGTASNTTSAASICEGSTKALTGSPAGGTWSVVSGGGTISSTTYTSPAVSSNATIIVRYTIAANGACPATNSDVSFTVNDNLGTASNTTSTAAICEGSTKALAASPAGGTWSVVSGGGTISSTTYTSPAVSSNATIIVRYTIPANGACPATNSDVSFTVNDNLGTASNTTSTAAICEGATKALAASPAGGSWSVVSGGGTISGTTYSSPVISVNTPVTVRYTIAANGACPATNSDVSFTVNDNLGTASNTTSTAAICEGASKALTASPAGGTWSVVTGGGTISGTTYTNPTVSSNTTVTVRYTIPTNGACPATISDVTFTVNNNLGTASNTTGTADICEGATKTLIASPAGGTWSVVSGGGTIAGTTYNSPVISANTPVTVRYTIAANGACPATNSDVSFTVNDNLGTASNTTSTAAICEGASKALTASPAGGTWSVVTGGGTISGTTYTNPTVSSNTTVTVRYTIPTNGACPATISDVTFTVNNNLGTASNTTGTADICEGATKTLIASPAGGTWSVVSGGGTITGTTYNSPVISANTPVTVRYTIAANGGCLGSTSDAVFTVNDNPGAANNTTSATNICEGSTKALTATPAGGTWSVLSGGGSISGTTYSNASVSSNSIVTVQYSMPANGACPITTSNVIFTVNDNVGTINNSTSTSDICEGATKALTATPSGGTWSVISGGGTISGTTYNSPVISANTLVTVRYTLAANGACPGASNDLSFNVNDNLGVANNTTPATDICEGSTKVLTATPAGGTWSVLSGGGSISGTTYSNASVSSNSTVTVQYSIPANGACPITTSNVIFTVNDNLGVASNTTSTADICEGATKALVATPAGGTWSVETGGGTISGTTYSSPVITANTPVTVRYTIAANGACVGTTSDVTFNVNDNPGAATNTTTTTDICEGATKALTASPAGGTWSVLSGGGSISGTTYSNASVSSNSTVTVQYSMPANGACPITTSNVIFTVNDNLGVANNTTDVSDICEGATKALIATPAAGTWSVETGGGTITGTTYNSPVISANTPVTVRYTIPANGACLATTSDVTFNVNDNPGVATNTTTTTDICEGATKALTATPAGGTWSVITGGGTITGTTFNSPVISANTTTTIRYSIAANGSCPGTTSDVIFTVNDNLGTANNTTSTADICEGDSKTLTATPAGGIWTIISGGGSISGTTYTNSTLSSNSVVTVQYSIPANGACPSSSSDVLFTVFDNIGTATITTANTAICAGDSKLLTATPAGGTWSIVSGSGTISGSTYNSNSTVSVQETITLAYTVSNGICLSSSNLTFTVNPIPGEPTIVSIGSDTLCAGQNTTITASNSAGGTLQWYTSNTPSGTPLNTGSSISVSPTVTTTYYVFGNTFSTCYSNTYDSVVVTVNSTSVPATSINASNTAVCSGETVTLTVNGGSLGIGANWVWYSGACGTNLLGQGMSITVTPTTNSTYFVRAEGDCGASTCVQIAISIQNNVIANFDIPSLLCVSADPVDLNDYLSPTSTTGGTWSGVPLTGTVLTPATLGLGNFTVTYTAGTLPCIDSVSHSFSIIAPSATINAQNDTYIILSDQTGMFEVTNNDTPSTMEVSSITNPTNGTASIQNNQIYYNANSGFRGLDSIIYTVCETVCVQSCDNAVLYIQVDTDVIGGGDGTDGNGNVGGWIVTPNGDGKDDVLYIDGLYQYPKNEILIFNRWGDEIFSAAPYKNDWNAKSPKDVVDGTYFFILKLTLLDNSEKIVKGYIHVENN